MGKLLDKYKEKGWKESPRNLRPYERAKVKESANGHHANGDWEKAKPNLVKPESYPYDPEDDSHQYGGARTHAVSDISVMTKVNESETQNRDLKRALKWDGNYDWNVIKTEIFNGEIRKVCGWLNLKKDFADRCYYFFRRIRDWVSFKGAKKIEDLAHAFIYFMCRFDNKPISLFDFRFAYQDHENSTRKDSIKEEEFQKKLEELPNSKIEKFGKEEIKKLTDKRVNEDFKRKIEDKINNIKNYTRWFIKQVIYRRHVCNCGFEWDDKLAMRNFDSLPDDWVCPDCGAPKKEIKPEAVHQFKEQDNNIILSKILNRLFPEKGIEIYLKVKEVMPEFPEQIFKNQKTLGAFLYMSLKNFLNYSIIQQDIADLCGCSTVTLREKIKFIEEKMAD